MVGTAFMELNGKETKLFLFREVVNPINLGYFDSEVYAGIKT